ncbi:MAG: alpha-amylase/4-alpha-glucanotransferase domain-containing protein [Candidatus Acidiferrales bacterium]
MSKFHLILVIHAHQPVGNFVEVLERTYQKSYLPFVECLEHHPNVRMGLHYSGPLLEWIEAAHPEYFAKLRGMMARGQIELAGGGFYEPILISIPPHDQSEQIARLAAYLERHFGSRPRGAWLAERVWEPQLASVLGSAGVDYTLVDDNHFLAAGFEPEQLFGYYVSEDRGVKVRVIPGLQSLRYLVPFREVGDVIGFLRDASARHPGGMAAMGDDLEKFGGWPGTYDHCYTNGWLERFFSALGSEASWLETSLPGEHLASHPASGRADLPTASYTEMMEWVLPTEARRRFHALRERFGGEPEVQRFLRGGFWRGFFSKYAESNLLNKKMLRASYEIERLGRRRRLPAATKKLAEARTQVLRAQCNDAYWHGVFGGLYSPHLRTALWNALIRAESLADSVENRRGSKPHAKRLDLDCDGAEEVLIEASQFSALVKPSDGGTIAALDDRRTTVTLVNSMMRRPEAYHDRLPTVSTNSGRHVASIHEQTRTKEEGLERSLRSDRWPRHSFRLLLFAPGKRYEDCDAIRLDENAAVAGGPYHVEEAEGGRVRLAAETPFAGGALHVRKQFDFSPTPEGFRVHCGLELSLSGAASAELEAGLELILNFLAPDEPDRYFETPEGRRKLRWGGTVAGNSLRIVDEWQGVAARIEAAGALRLWVVPIETVSESEEGFERVYQGSQIIPVWPVRLDAQTVWTAGVNLQICPVSKG